MSVGSGQFGAAGQDLCELHPFVLVEAVGVASQPAGDLPEGWRYRHRGWRRAGFAERLQVAADGLVYTARLLSRAGTSVTSRQARRWCPKIRLASRAAVLLSAVSRTLMTFAERAASFSRRRPRTHNDPMGSTGRSSSEPLASADGSQQSGRIVVGVDGSQGSLNALLWAFGEARARKIPVHAVFAWQYYPPWVDPGLGSMFPLRYRPGGGVPEDEFAEAAASVKCC